MKLIRNDVYWNIDSNGNIYPITSIDKYVIDSVDATVQLKEVPVVETLSIKKLITVLNQDDNVKDFVEVLSGDITLENHFKVNYTTNEVQFHQSQKGKEIMVKCMSEGRVGSSAKNVYMTKDSSGNIGNNVESKIVDLEVASESFAKKEFVVKEVEELNSNIETIEEGVKNKLGKEYIEDIEILISDFKHSGDGVADDTLNFVNIENNLQNKIVNLLGKTYLVSSYPSLNQYINGTFLLPTGSTRKAPYVKIQRIDESRVIIGDEACKNSPTYRDGNNYNLIAIGKQALANGRNIKHITAIGHGALQNCDNTRYNVAIGLESLLNTNGNSENDGRSGSRNTAIGDNTGRFNTSGYGNCFLGRNSGQCNNGDRNIAIGIGAMSGNAPLDLDNTIKNQEPTTTSDNIAVGVDSLYSTNSSSNVAIGNQALREQKDGIENLAIGHNSLAKLQSDKDVFGKVKTVVNLKGTYAWNNSEIVVTISNHSVKSGDKVLVQYNTGEASLITVGDRVLYDVKSVTVNTFTFTVPQNGDSNGEITLCEIRSGDSTNVSNYNLTIGNNAMGNTVSGTGNTCVGYKSAYEINGNENVALGMFTLLSNLNGINNTALGYRSLSFGVGGSSNTAVGHLSSSHIIGDNNTSLGVSSLRYMQDGSYASNLTNATAIGYNSRVSGNNQVQLGNADTTTYVYGTVQNRSDLRDKTDIRDTQLGLEFINTLRPIDFKWDYREKYEELDEQGNIIKTNKDGSKKGSRYHHGLIAQEVKDTMDKLGVEFGGYQDHSKNGGNDVLSIGYDELIAPLIKSIQELTARVKELESKI